MKRTLLTMACVAATFAGVALAEYPEKPVSFIVPWPPGDLEDVLTRIIANEFQEMYGVSNAVVNKPGGGGGPFPGAVEVAIAPADGYTIGSFVTDIPISRPEVGIAELNPHPFEPIGKFMTVSEVLEDLDSTDAASLAHRIDEVDESRSESFLAKLVLLLAYKNGNTKEVQECIDDAAASLYS